jgi:hypothetical protein
MQSIDFQLENAQGQSVIYVTQDATQNVLTFTLTYSGAAAVTLKGGAPVAEDKITAAGPTSFYFTVSKVLSPQEFAAMLVTPPAGWQAKLIGSWVLTPLADVTLQPGQSVKFALTKITANGQAGPGSFNIDYYNIPTIADSGTQLPLSLQHLPNLHKRLADSMSISMVGGNSVYIDVNDRHLIPSNTLVLQLNNMTRGPLVSGSGQGTPVFYLSFVSANARPGYGALTTIDRLKNITVGTNGDYGTAWNVQNHGQDTPPYWAIYPKSPEILGTGAAAIAEFRISSIVTDFDPSSTNLYFHSVDIPGFDDGSVTQPLLKAVPQLALQGVATLKDNVPSGSQVGLIWTSFNANRCTLSPVNSGEVSVPIQSASATGYPVTVDRTTTFTLTAYNDALGSRTSAPVTVNVLPVTVTKALTADPPTGYHFGDKVSLSWAFSSAQSCSVDPPINGSNVVPVQSPGTLVYPTAAVYYTLTAQGQAGPATTSLDVVPIPNGWKNIPGAGLWDTRGRPVLLAPFLDRIWFLAGGPDDLKSIVFSSRDGFTWSIANNAAAFSPRGNAAGCVFGGKLWLTGGATLNGGLLDEIWSSGDGVTWTKAAATQHWSARSGHGCLAVGGKIWVMGGRDATGALLNDVWSSVDGVSWNRVTPSAIWPARSAFGAANFVNNLCVVAGTGASGPLGDVWLSSDGVNWNGLGNPPWPVRSSPNVAVLGQHLYVVGGTAPNGQAFSDSNIADPSGKWNMGLGPNWNNQVLNLGAAAFRGAIWFAGGSASGSPNTTVWGFGI